MRREWDGHPTIIRLVLSVKVVGPSKDQKQSFEGSSMG